MSEQQAEKEKSYWTSGEIENLVRGQYPPPAYVVLTELRDGTGFSTPGREADAVAFGLWPSRGLDIIGFEFKSSRSDWKSELGDPAKAESIGKFCDQWWIVAHESVVKLEEVPTAWGWYAPGPKGIKMMKPVTRDPESKPKELTRPFLMSIMRKLDANYKPARLIDQMVEKRGAELADHRAGVNKERLREAEKLEKIIANFKQASGIDLGNEWSYPNYPPHLVGAIVKMLMSDQMEHHVKQIGKAAEFARKSLAALAAIPLPRPADLNKNKRSRKSI